MRLFLRTHRTGFDAVHVGRPVRFFAGRLIIFSVCSLLLAAFMFAAPAASSAYVAVSVTISPPAIPIYVQPACPGPGYMWTPGYWAWDPVYGYYWVPGTWVLAPFTGALWTPGYWAWRDADDGFVWYSGFWGPIVGFYGGIDYGFGYTGYGYQGGYWRQGVFYYNRAVNRVDVVNIRNVYYNRTVVRNTTRVSYNGGSGGINARPDRAQSAAERERRDGPVREQLNQQSLARRDPSQRVSYNHGAPPIAATPRPGRFMDRGAVHASRAGGPYRPIQPNRGPAKGSIHQPAYSPARHRIAPRPNSRPSQPPYRAYKPRPNAGPQRQMRPEINHRAGPQSGRGNPHQRGNPQRPTMPKGKQGKPGVPHVPGRFSRM